jgi:hypothetical protein
MSLLAAHTTSVRATGLAAGRSGLHTPRGRPSARKCIMCVCGWAQLQFLIFAPQTSGGRFPFPLYTPPRPRHLTSVKLNEKAWKCSFRFLLLKYMCAACVFNTENELTLMW